MPSETIYYYCFGPTDNDGVNVLSYVNNVYAAKMAMLRMYGRKESDIKFWSGSERRGCPMFDGRNYH